MTYGLGSECDNLPGFIVLDSGLIPPGGMDCFGSGFLPASYQGTLFRRGLHPIADIVPREPALQVGKLDLIRKLNRGVVQRLGSVSELEATISNYELAFRMQSAVPELLDLTGETETTKAMYGLDGDDTSEFGRQCLLARRMVERGVRFIELLSPARKGQDRWDQHQRLEEGHRINARATDKPIAALLKDLKARGLLDSTLVYWGGEFEPHADRADKRRRVRAEDWTGPQSIRLHDVASRRRRQGRRAPRCNRRVRLLRG